MKKATGAFAAFLYTTSAMGATLLPNGQQQFVDATGKPYANGKVYFYENFPTCTTPKNTYKDPNKTVSNGASVTLDAAGRATIFGEGAYCQVLKDANNTTIWTKYTSDTSSASNLGWGEVSSGTANAQTITVSGFNETNGQTMYFVAGYTNTGATTLKVNSYAPAAIVKTTDAGVKALTGGEIFVGNVIGVTYVKTSGQFQLITNNNTATGYVGEVRTFAYTGCPGGWLPADGSAVSIATYGELYSVLGSTWGVSAGNVVLPDFRGMFLRGSGTNATYPTAIGGAIGVSGYQADIYLNHNHTQAAHTHTITPANPVTGGSQGSFGAAAVPPSPYVTLSTTPSSASSETPVINNSTTGGTETRPKNYSVQYCIKY